MKGVPPLAGCEPLSDAGGESGEGTSAGAGGTSLLIAGAGAGLRLAGVVAGAGVAGAIGCSFIGLLFGRRGAVVEYLARAVPGLCRGLGPGLCRGWPGLRWGCAFEQAPSLRLASTGQRL